MRGSQDRLLTQRRQGAERQNRLQNCDTAECNSALRGWCEADLRDAAVKLKRCRRFAVPPHSIMRRLNVGGGVFIREQGWQRARWGHRAYRWAILGVAVA